jgi:O-antigen/teichoic acid export membrane protein
MALLTMRAFETTSSEGRSRERYRRVALSAISSLGARLIGFATSLISIRLALQYLGAERYGLWATISAFTGLFAFMDLGVGNGLINAVAAANGRDDVAAARRYISSALALLASIALILGVLFAVVYPLISWAGLFNVMSPPAIAAAGPTTLVFVAIFLVSLPVSVVSSVQLGYQDGFINGLWVSVANVSGLIAMIAAIQLQANLPWLALASVGVLPIVMLVNSFVVFRGRRASVSPRLEAVSRVAVRHVARLGSLFLVLGIAGAVAYGADNLVIARILGASRVPEYAIPLRLFWFVPGLVGFVLTPLWPAYGEAVERGDTDWVRQTFKRSLLFAALVNVPVACSLVILGPAIIRGWVGSEVPTPSLMMVGMGLWAALNTFGGPFSAFLNGVHVIRFQAVTACLMAVVNIGLSIVLVRRIGPAGAVYGSAVAQVFVVVVPSAIYIRRLLSSWRSKQPS